MSDTCVILLNMGGPTNGDEVKPFLRALFADPDLIQFPLKRVLAPLIVSMRTPKVRRRYAQIEGGSPLLRMTQAQADSLARALNREGSFKFEVLVGMRYTSPSISEALERSRELGCHRIIGLSMYPQYCRSTTGSSLAELERAAGLLSGISPIRVIDRYFDRSAYLDAQAAGIETVIKRMHGEPFVLFSAHGVPVRMVEEGDPYVGEIEATVAGVVERLALAGDRWELSYQSRVGPVRWVGPASDEVIEDLAARSVTDLVIVPISFTADCLETLYDIEIVLAGKARAAGIPRVERVPALNDSQAFIEALAELVREVG
ncbi:MAG: ferrochelatase [Deltaproteobacteria bacterium]|nr:ferrochelatase [Deltaproteobacteria bacterium]